MLQSCARTCKGYGGGHPGKVVVGGPGAQCVSTLGH